LTTLLLLFASIGLIACAFATYGLWRDKSRSRLILSLTVTLFVLGIGGGTYWAVGEPYLAWRALDTRQNNDIRELIPRLIIRVRKAPRNEQSWILLGQAYMKAGAPREAAKAYSNAISLAQLQNMPDPALASAYGEALVAQAGGSVSPEAENAFQAALDQDPTNPAARYFVGLALATRGDREGAISFWRTLLADTPSKSPLHQILVNQLALLAASADPSALNPRKMVAGLAARLKSEPRDERGWQQLIRAYSVLGERAKAKGALMAARRTFAGNDAVLATLATEAKGLQLE
jgi:cytochrome c-type biogenesis protein CcmH